MFTLESLEIVLPAAIAGLMVAILHVPLGIEVLRRGIIFIDLAHRSDCGSVRRTGETLGA